MIKLMSLALGVFVIVSVGANSIVSQPQNVDKLGWISGCWMSDDGKERIEESWMKPAGQSLMGISRTVAGGKTVFTEYIQIRESNGHLAYIVSIGLSAKPVAFNLVKLSDSEAVFENPEHDFPQRIIYRRESPEALFARIEGQEKGINKAIDFRYKRSRCD